ncbi:MAG: S9 family peptidase, partial [Bacteroidales bacterium]|nr:S9 family peptidase [Bacteroidales bacterium]
MKRCLFALLTVLLPLNTKESMSIPRRIPLEDFFRNPEKANFQLSPKGDFISYTAPYKGRMNLFVRPVANDTAIQLTFETDRDIRAYFWANNKRILFLKDNGGDENYKLYGVNTDGTDYKCLTDFDGVRTEIIDDLEDIEDEV